MIKVVHITWRDAATADGWKSHKAKENFVEEVLSVINTVGFLVVDNEDKVVIMHSHSENQVLGLLEIPRGCVNEIREICEIGI